MAWSEQSHFMERILYLLRLMEENGLDMDLLDQGEWPFEGVSAEEEREIRAAQECIHFMDEMPGGFFIYYADGDERLIHANRGMLRMFQCDTLQEFRKMTGNSFRGIVYREDLEEVERSVHMQIASNQYDLDHVEYRICRKDGSLRWVEDYGHFIHGGATGDVFYVFLGEATDERNQQQIRQKRVLTEALEKADMAVKAKNAFLSQMSHEMRTPLNAIFGFTTLAKTSLHDPDTATEYLEQVEVASRQLLDMITKALDVSNLSSAAGSSQEKECDLPDMLQEIYDFLQPQAQEKGIGFTLDCKQVSHRVIYADPAQLRQLVLNLANNAITYTESGGVDVILAEEKTLPDNHAVFRLEVRDTGVGISEEFLEKAFEPFSREKTSTLSGVRGIGLGLTIAKSIVDLMDGTITVNTAVDRGSTFTVLLPFRVQPLEGDPGKWNSAASPSLRILLAEDNEINREIETELLERMGFVIDPVADGKEAFEKVRQASPGDYDLMIVDLQMPVMDGWQVAAAVRKLPDPTMSHIPIIALSANVRMDDRRRSLESGIDVHLPKPMDLNLLLETIEKITKKSVR